MGDKISFYAGADYGLDSKYGELFKEVGAKMDYRFSAGSFGVATDPRTANQIKSVSDRLNTGSRTIEVSGLTMPVLDSIPKQHLKEINRLKNLAGVDLTFHGPLVEATGIDPQNRTWNENLRKQAEGDMISAVRRAHELDPEGNIVVTFHSSNGLPEPETRVWETPEGKNKPEQVIKSIAVIDERTGQFGSLGMPKKDYFLGKEANPKKELEILNDSRWSESLNSLTINADRGRGTIKHALSSGKEIIVDNKGNKENLSKFYALSVEKPEEYNQTISSLKEMGGLISEGVNEINHGRIFLHESYRNLQEMYNQAYDSFKREGKTEQLKKLDEFRESASKKLEQYKDNPLMVSEFADEVSKGISVLSAFKEGEKPRIFKELKGFAIDKASDTFSNVAFDAYKQFKGNAPIISIENPPAGSGLSRGEDLRDLVKASQKKFIEKGIKSGMSESEAEAQAKKLIGVTWDVGHINMIRKSGYGDKELKAETEKVAPFVKHIHLSDNFGLEHTELPMGMGNVPMKEHIEALKAQYGDKLDKIKKIAETGNWYEHFKVNPMGRTLEAFGSPIYPMQMGPYWNSSANASGGYFGGYGMVNPETHHSIYGAGFSTLPVELGGQMAGKSRVSGNPID